MTTRYKIAEQVLRIVNGGDPTEDSSIDIREVLPLVDQERDSLIKSELMDWYYTKSTSTAKGELEINGGWLSQATVALRRDASRNNAIFGGLHFNYISLPNDMGIQKVETYDTRFTKQGDIYRIKGGMKKTAYNTERIEIVFNSGPKVLDKKYRVTFDFNIKDTLMSDGVTNQYQYGGVRSNKISFNVDTTGYDSFENTQYNFLLALINSPGFKKFAKDYDIGFGITETDVNDNAFIDLESSISQTIQVSLKTNYGSSITNFKINGVGKYATDPFSEYGGIQLGGLSATNDNLGFGWIITSYDTSINDPDIQTTAYENSHGIGFIINGTIYSSEFVNPKTALNPIDIINLFVQENAHKISVEQNITCEKGQLNVPPNTEITLTFHETIPGGGFEIDPITPGNVFEIEKYEIASPEPTPAGKGFKQIIYTRMPSGGEHNSLFDKTARKTGRQYYYIENLADIGAGTGIGGGAAIYLYKQYDLDLYNNSFGNQLRVTYIGTSDRFSDHAAYPIPADYEKIIIKNLVELLTVMKNASDDMANDNID
jgi:hypothetical protein